MKHTRVEAATPHAKIYDALECDDFLFSLFRYVENSCLGNQVYFTVERLKTGRTKLVLPQR